MNNEPNILENVDNYINSFIGMYSQEYMIPNGLKCRIQVVDDISVSVGAFMKRTNRKYTSDGTDYNGTTCIPNNVDEETEIFISRKLIENYKINNWQFMCTLFHELTHAIDFYNYCNEYFQGNYDAMINRNDAYGFHMWTEFNAKHKSYLLYSRFIRKCMEDSNLPKVIPTDGEVELQNDIITESIRNNVVDKAVYDIIQYLGRYYCWEIDYSDDFIDGKLFPDIFKHSLEPVVSDLYSLLKQSNDSVMYYNDVARTIRLLMGKLVLVEHKGGII